MKCLFFCFLAVYCCSWLADARVVGVGKKAKVNLGVISFGAGSRTLYGLASYYADKFDGKPTATGEPYDHTKFTAACNMLPLGTWIKVTNIINSRSVVVRTNDRLHIKMKRLVDLSRIAAEQLGYTKRGLTQVKVEVLEKL
jgi:rare lipoprotein A